MKVFIRILDQGFSIWNKALEFHADVSREALRAECQRSDSPDQNPKQPPDRFIHHLKRLMMLLRCSPC
jgi:hypothetical protein